MTAARQIAHRTLLGVFKLGRSLDDSLKDCPEKLPQRDRSLVAELCFGVLRWQPKLNSVANSLLHKPLKTKDLDVQTAIWMGLYQIAFMRVPEHAAVAETVNLVGRRKPWAKGLANAVLRRFAQQSATLLAAETHTPAAACAHPEWLYDRIRRAWPAQHEGILAANNARAPMTLRVNSKHTTRAAYLAELTRTGIPASAHPLVGTAIELASAVATERLPKFGDGWVSVQDAAAQLAATLLVPQPGHRILDACAAPGGKTGHLLEMVDGNLDLVALDNQAERLVRIRENLNRLNLEASLLCGDAMTPETWWDGRTFDRILVDAPCSATGVIRRHPDIKHLRRDSDIRPLADKQLRILNSLWPLLRSGGRLLYVTCSVLPEENSGVAGRLLAKAPTSKTLQLPGNWGEDTEHGRQTLPGNANMDGFYFALFVKS